MRRLPESCIVGGEESIKQEALYQLYRRRIGFSMRSLLTPEEAAAKLGITVVQLNHLVAQGRITPVKPSRNTNRYCAEDVEAMLASDPPKKRGRPKGSRNKKK
jgi:hypothetical protein